MSGQDIMGWHIMIGKGLLNL